MYEDLSRALHTTQTAHFNVVMGDSNAKVGVHISGESVVGPHGFRSRNHRGQMLVNFLEKRDFSWWTLSLKQPQRKWAWRSPDPVTRNEIDFIISDKRRIFRDVPVVNRLNTGSDHKLIRGTLNIDYKLKCDRLMKSTLRPNLLQTVVGSETFQLKLEYRFAALETTTDIDQLVLEPDLYQVVGLLQYEGMKLCQMQNTGKESKLSQESLQLMQRRGEISTVTHFRYLCYFVAGISWLEDLNLSCPVCRCHPYPRYLATCRNFP